MVRIEVGDEGAGRRLDVVLADALGVSRSKAGDLVAAGAVSVDGRSERKSYRVAVGDVVEVSDAPAPSAAPPEGVEVLYEDDHLLVASKPAGVVTHAAPGLREGTLVDALVASGRHLATEPGPDRPGIVHRLDRDVSGVLVVAKTDDAYAALSAAMARREIERTYLALVAGVPATDRGKIDAPIARDPKHPTRMSVLPEGRAAVTWFRVLERFTGWSEATPSKGWSEATASEQASMLEVRLETGRTHQIRTHLASIGHPVVGDAAYGRDPRLARRLGLARPFLHARRLAFAHPVTGERIVVSCDLPPELERTLAELRS